MRKKVFITTHDMQLALSLIRLLYRAGIDAFWVTEEEGEKLAEGWVISGWIRANLCT